MSGQSWIVNSDHTLKCYIEHVTKQYEEHGYLLLPKIQNGKQRSAKQNAALHVFLRLLSKALNSAGLDMRRTLKPGTDIPWSPETCKEHLWKPIQLAMTKKESTTESLRQEYSEIYEVLNRHMGQKFGISIPWPEKLFEEKS